LSKDELSDRERQEALHRASATFKALRASRMFARDRNLFGTRSRWLLGRQYEYLWPFATTWSALCTLGSLPGNRRAIDLAKGMLEGLAAYSREPQILEANDEAGFESVVTPPVGSGGDRYFDDNAWLGLALVRLYELTGALELLSLAERIFTFVVSGWSTDTTWHLPGGIRWKEPSTNHSRNTCANGPACALAARLYEKTARGDYLEWATRIYSWTRRALLGSDALYFDRVAPDGTPSTTIWSYNQGTMIGAGVLLARITQTRSFLDESAATATAYVNGRGVTDLMTQDPAFNAVFFRNVLLLDQEQPDTRYRDLMSSYASAMWQTKRMRHGFFAGNGSLLNNTAAMVQTYALVAGAQAHA